MSSELKFAELNLFAAQDEVLQRTAWGVLYGASARSSASRIQCHVFGAFGVQSYPRIAVSPSASSYAAVEQLPEEEQGDDVCRGLAFVLYKHFSEIPQHATQELIKQRMPQTVAPHGRQPFSSSHAADLAIRMVKLDLTAHRIAVIKSMMKSPSPGYLDLDIVLPPGSLNDIPPNGIDASNHAHSFSSFAPLINRFGEVTSLQTSKSPRHPSKPFASALRTTVFSFDQKEALHRQMCELVDTEERYVGKLYDLVHDIATPLLEKAQSLASEIPFEEKKAVESLFPASLNRVLDTSTRFMLSCRKLLDATELKAMKDILNSNQNPLPQDSSDSSRGSDPTAALAFAKLLLKWIPDLGSPYEDYVGSHAGFRDHVKTITRNPNSQLATQVQSIGEQRLMSLLIEPIQRLPRYSLYIDEMAKQLPLHHPALEPLQKAREAVSKICSRETTTTSQPSLLDRIRRVMPSWPSHFDPGDRLVAAADVDELDPPYDVQQSGKAYIMLLFPRYLALIENSKTSASHLLTEVTRPRHTVSLDTVNSSAAILSTFWTLHRISFAVNEDDSLCQIFPQGPCISLPTKSVDGGLIHAKDNDEIRTFRLGGSYAGKASLWTKETCKARIESRFSEGESTHKWEVRELKRENHGLGFLSAVCEERQRDESRIQKSYASITILVEPRKDTSSILAGDKGTGIVATAAVTNANTYKLEIDTLNIETTRDVVNVEQFVPIITRRLREILRARLEIRNVAIIAPLLRHNQRFLDVMDIPFGGSTQHIVKQRTRAPTSPVKVLSTFFGGVAPSKSEPVILSKPVYGMPHKNQDRTEAATFKMGSVLRTWSKRERLNNSQPLLHNTLSRSRSTILQPKSRDPSAITKISEEPRPLREVSHNRVHRRSSLSDLKPAVEEPKASPPQTISNPPVQLADAARPVLKKYERRPPSPIKDVSSVLQAELDTIANQVKILSNQLVSPEPNGTLESPVANASTSVDAMASSIHENIKSVRDRIGDVFAHIAQQRRTEMDKMEKLLKENLTLQALNNAQNSSMRNTGGRGRFMTRAEWASEG